MHPPEVLAAQKKNLEAYNSVKKDMEERHWGKTVLLHDGKVIAIYNDGGDAYSIACEKFVPGYFSLQRVGARPVDLGIHSAPLAARG